VIYSLLLIMADPVYNEIKQEFQLERMIFFSDAVFAIAITLLIIELKVPEIFRPITEDKLLDSLDLLIPRFIGFIVSFFLIGLYWTIHHSIFGYVIKYNTRLLWINLLFLFGIVLMPFSTSFFSEYFLELKKTPVVIYTINICYLGLMNYFLWRYITSPKHLLTEKLPAHLRTYRSFRAIIVPVIFICMLTLYLFSPQYAIFIPPLIPLIMYLISIIYKRKYKDQPLRKSGN